MVNTAASTVWVFLHSLSDISIYSYLSGNSLMTCGSNYLRTLIYPLTVWHAVLYTLSLHMHNELVHSSSIGKWLACTWFSANFIICMHKIRGYLKIWPLHFCCAWVWVERAPFKKEITQSFGILTHIFLWKKVGEREERTKNVSLNPEQIITSLTI